MDYPLKERIGKPDLFIGRKKELAFFLKWIDDIKQEKSQSTAMLARRKMGKTAIKEAEDYCKMKGIACSEDERWLAG